MFVTWLEKQQYHIVSYDATWVSYEIDDYVHEALGIWRVLGTSTA